MFVEWAYNNDPAKIRLEFYLQSGFGEYASLGPTAAD